MFAAALIVFRESLEAALFVGIVAAATRGLVGRGRWLGAGVAIGVLGALILAALAPHVSSWFDGMGQDMINIAVLSVALTMLLWHCIWVTTHTREMVVDAQRLGTSVQEGERKPWALLTAVALAVLREGAETVLFLSGIALSGESSPASMAIGGIAGLAAGAALGFLVFAGLLRIPLKWFFSATSVLVLLLAAGMAAQSARFLIQADVLPSLATPLWDTSALLPQGSIVGVLLHSLVGYEARPAGMQIVFYVAVLFAIGAGMTWINKSGPRSARTRAAS